MFSNNSNESRAAWAGGYALGIGLVMGLGAMASPAAAAPFAYVTNFFDGTVSVIDTATNMVVTGPGFPLTVGVNPLGVAVTPDGKHAYVVNRGSNNVSVIDTATNTVEAATLAVGSHPFAIAVTPDGKHAYVVNQGSNNVSVIDTATNTVEAATLAVGVNPRAVAVTPDGTHAYFANGTSGEVSVIDTVTNKVVATVTVGFPFGVAVTPDGKHVYAANGGDPGTVLVIATATNTVVTTVTVGLEPQGVAVTPDGKQVYVANLIDADVSVIDTATNNVVATLAVGSLPDAVAVAPDGKHAYVTNNGSNTVSVIDTATNTVEPTVVMVGTNPSGVAIVPPPPGIPFLAFGAKIEIDFGATPNQDAFELHSQFTLSSTEHDGIHPDVEPVKLQVGTFTIAIPPGSFKKQKDGSFTFVGVIHGVILEALIRPTGTLRYAFDAEATSASLTGTKNTVYATLIIGDDSGATSVTAKITH